MKLRTKVFVLALLSFYTGNMLRSQEKINASIGIGLPELLNIGLFYQFNQTQAGICVGTMPNDSDEKIISVSGDMYLHFGKTSSFSARRTWYARAGLTYLRDETDQIIDKYLLLNTRIGKDLNISSKIGIAIDAGVVFEVSRDEIRKKPPSGWNLDFNFPILPAAGLRLFYRI